MGYEAKILADSYSDAGVRLTTFEVTFPRFILAEVNTHRMLSRNSASSRAIPVAKAIKMVREDPFIPEAFIKNQPGMVADNVVDDETSLWSRDAWLHAMNVALSQAERLDKYEVHKALANRIIEPWKWHTAIITATEWDNFFALRTDRNAQPEFRKIALMMQDLYTTQAPLLLDEGEWHLPLVHDHEIMGDLDIAGHVDWEYWKMVSVGRCARVSYLTHDGVRDPDKDIQLHNQLMSNGHLSPFEHVATPMHPATVMPEIKYSGNFRGWDQYRKSIPNEDNFAKVMVIDD